LEAAASSIAFFTLVSASFSSVSWCDTEFDLSSPSQRSAVDAACEFDWLQRLLEQDEGRV
jgi:hypothetical protein